MRHLARQHFAFLRGMVNGLPVDELWSRYLAIEGESSDARLVRRTINELRAALSEIAARRGLPGTARLLRMDLGSLPPQIAPTLEEFAEEHGLEGEREADQIAAYEAYYGKPSRKEQARVRLLKRQLRALHMLEDLAAVPPQFADRVRSWFPARIANRLEEAGCMTLHGLASRIAQSPTWWRSIKGIGEIKAARIEAWMRESNLVIQPTALAAVATRTLVLGASGANRKEGLSLLGAPSDLEAVKSWLASYTGHTLRAYRREAERLLLWAAIERKKPLSGMTREDMLAYQAFLANPQPADRWCGPRSTPRNSPAWRPFEGPLSPSAQNQAISILSGLFDFLVGSGYLKGNPALHLAKIARPAMRQQFGRRRLSADQWAALRRSVGHGTPRQERLGLILDLLYATGLRLSELIAAQFNHLSPIVDDAGETGWILSVLGKGSKYREVPVPDDLVQRAWRLARNRGVQGDDLTSSAAHLIGPIAGKLGRQDFDPMAGVHPRTIAHEIAAHAKSCADSLRDTNPKDAERIERVSAHWLRHTHASRALESGVDLVGVQANLGHASLATTSIYLSAEQKRRLRQMRNFWQTT